MPHRPSLPTLASLALLLLPSVSTAQGMASEAPQSRRTDEAARMAAVQPLPTELRPAAGVARVVGGTLETVQESGNGVVCQLDDPADESFIVHCYPTEMWGLILRYRELSDALNSRRDARKQIQDEIEAGRWTLPEGPVMGYHMWGPEAGYDWATGHHTEEIAKWQTIHVPYATAEAMGVTTQQEHSEHGLPGMMPYMVNSGEWLAHVMIRHSTW